MSALPGLYYSLKCNAMGESTLSAKNQNRNTEGSARQVLGVRADDKLLIVVRGARVIVLQKPESHSVAIQGLTKTPFPDGYLKKERQSWD
ncbi:MAG: hypothetical protein M3Y24_09415 [Acidobacteriota bacterium]|nr:hypothetical protein [Acidobacteriota bacterium]